MRTLILVLFLLSRAAMLAQSQSHPQALPMTDWSRVETLAPGTHIVITNDLRFPLGPFSSRKASCTLDIVTPDGLGCASIMGTVWFSRAGIAQVHLTDHGKGVLIGSAIGAAIGATITIPNSDATNAGSRALYGGLLGLFLGLIIALGIHPAGQLLYDQP